MDAVFGSLLQVFGQALSLLYDVVKQYGIAIIILTILIRVALLPLTIKQTRSMAQMQEIQPQIKEIQRKHKGNRQKLNEELMKVYKEHKVNPLGGCLPLLMQAPFFIALYAVLGPNATSLAAAIPDDLDRGRVQSAVCVPYLPSSDGDNLLPRVTPPGSNEIRCSNGDEETFEVEEWVHAKTGGDLNANMTDPPPEMFRCVAEERGGSFDTDYFVCKSPPGTGHLPKDGALYADLVEEGSTFAGMELQCSPSAAGSSAGLGACTRQLDASGKPAKGSPLKAIPYYLLIGGMVFTTWYQQKQMQQMSGQTTPQMQMMGRIMPVFLGFISFSIPAGVLLYWVTTNVWQVGQQRVMMRSRAKAAAADGSKKPSAAKEAVKGDGKGNGKKPVATPPAQRRPNPAGRGGSRRSGGGSRKKRRKR
jgi:YidC/Oxa1 family membrane protein insertase